MRNRISQNGHVGKETMGDKGKGDRIIGDWHLALTTYFLCGTRFTKNNLPLL